MNVSVLGCGNMGRAVIRGLKSKYGKDVTINVFDKVEESLSFVEKDAEIVAPEKWFSEEFPCDAVIIAVKPQDMKEALSSFGKMGKINTLWVSIAAGVTLSRLEELLGKSSRICRVMPNTPALIGEAVSCYTLNGQCSNEDAETVERTLSAFGECVRVRESMMDAVTGLSGSGPAYVYLFIESLIEAGVTAGLPLETAKKCAMYTVRGAADMVINTGETPGQLKNRVMSPGGTTVEGLHELEKAGFKSGIISAVNAAARRSAELGSGNNKKK